MHREVGPHNWMKNSYFSGYQRLTIDTSLEASDALMAFAKLSVKLMNKVIHQCADIVGMVMAQVLLKATLKKWGKEVEESVGRDMKQLHRQNSFKPMHWKSLMAEQCKKVLESHIFVERKQDGILKVQQVTGWNKQRGYIMKEDTQVPPLCLWRLSCSCALLMQTRMGMLLLLISRMHLSRLLLRMKRTKY
jgi:hypothetical protein